MYLSNAALEACLAESNSNIEQLQAQCRALQARLASMEAAHAADMDAMTNQLADSAGALAAKEVAVRSELCSLGMQNTFLY